MNTPLHTHKHTQPHTSAQLFLETPPNLWDRRPYKAFRSRSDPVIHTRLLESTSLHFFAHFKPETKASSMKRRRLVLSPPLLPTITETLEDTSNQCSQSLEDYMTSIQALARPVEAPSHSITRFQRSPRTKHFAKGQIKLSASPRTLRTSRPKTKDYGLSGNITEELPLKTGRDCRDKDPLDWLFGQRT